MDIVDIGIPRTPLGFFPTPLTELHRLTSHLAGPRLFVKRDDLTGLAFGGNKTRKLEFLIGDALARGCDTVITGGAGQSNHCRQTAAAAAACGLACHLVLGGAPPTVPNGNLLLDILCGATIHWSGDLRKGESIPEIESGLRRAGRKPYVIPYGGSNAIGALGFVEATRELSVQMAEAGLSFTHIVFASSSGGTQAGLVLGARMLGLSTKIVGIGIEKEEAGEAAFEQRIVEIANAAAEMIEAGCVIVSDDIAVRKDYGGEGYGVIGSMEREAVRMMAETEGIFLDPIYTGRAMGGLIDMIRRGELGPEDRVLFWHTGGGPGLFAHAGEVVG
jgi:L-cysteate sulfo-lyase